MRILYVATKYEYGKVELGLGFEHNNFYGSLLGMGHDLLYFDFHTLLRDLGRYRMNRRLLEIAVAEKPDLMFTCLMRDELDKRTLRRITDSGITTTYNWFCDDHWRFDTFSRYWAPCFNWVSTTDTASVEKYHGLGYKNVVKTQWAVHPFLYRNLGLPLEHDVTFVGQPHGSRRQTLAAIEGAGVNVKPWGDGWRLGRITQDAMIRVFNTSRINLNFCDSSASLPATEEMIRRLVSNWMIALPGGYTIKSWAGAALARIRQFKKRQHRPPGPHSSAGAGGRLPAQIKGRNFEVPGCGGFLLTGYAPDLERYYEIGSEIECYRDVEDLIEKVRYYLANEDRRAGIAHAGYSRTIREHTYLHRFREIFERMGLPSGAAPEVLLQGEGGRGSVVGVG